SGDILLEVGGISVNSGTSIQEQISRFSPGDKVDLVLLRGNKEVKVTVILQSQSGNTELIKESDGNITHFLGAQLRPAPKEIRDKLRIRTGIEVVSLGEGKLKDAGIRKGFVITHVNQKPVSTVQQFALAIQSAQRGTLIEGRYPDGSVYYYALGN
ncbi:MAG: PDZ domain-containing protein, partial [Bacteroidales bacterium]